MIEVGLEAVPVGETPEEMARLALAASQIKLPDSFDPGEFGHEVIWIIMRVPGYARQVYTPGMDAIGAYVQRLHDAAELLADAVDIFGPERYSDKVEQALARKIKGRLTTELQGISSLGGGLLNFTLQGESGPDGTIYYNHPPHDFLTDLAPRLHLLRRSLAGMYELTAAAHHIKETMRRAGVTGKSLPQKTPHKPKSPGGRVIEAVINDLLDLWGVIYGEGALPKVSPLRRGDDGPHVQLSAGKQFPALVRFVCGRSNITIRTESALHQAIMAAKSARAGERPNALG